MPKNAENVVTAIDEKTDENTGGVAALQKKLPNCKTDRANF